MMPLDKLDRDLLNLLQQDSTLPLKEIADKVNSSVATCQRRIQLLTEKGIIAKQVAVVSPKAVGKAISVFVMVEMDNQHSYYQEQFERKMREESDVMSCYEISGDYDFMLLIHTSDMESYHAFTRRVLTGEYHVRTYKSLFVMNFTKAESGILL
ncbi:AsnC family transcriptional regulator [Rodentibacter rarus]|uniref:AsnC family transcriptional regulator n=1 Tax=Rodentibacter rarus TaxID=1908260 RepID=A0A1V3IRM6_9PAST|nr:Lrp/AsnC family transcriptional regulator [Rodentibacter rarus]OOF43243.1 AsnC family transcriptional regulator [Rodentibacter rarus]OOF44877.1 AsnC family transcriptional regulator [Rodentibacter rarus]